MDIKIAVSPAGRSTVAIPTDAYNQIRDFIFELLQAKKEVTLNELLFAAEQHLSASIGESLGFWILKIKQELEICEAIKVQRSLGMERTQFISLFKKDRFIKF
jgi:hypothetical protein